MAFQLQLIHSSDNESNFKDVNTLEDKVVNYAAITDGLQDEAAVQGWASLHVTAGDHTLPNLFYSAGETTEGKPGFCLLYTSPSPRDLSTSRMPSSA